MKSNPTYSIRLNCEKCFKFIDIDLSVDIHEKDQYGIDEKYKNKRLPNYLLAFLETFNRFFHDYMKTKKNEYNHGIPLYPKPHSNSIQVNPTRMDIDEKFFLCSACATLEKLKE